MGRVFKTTMGVRVSVFSQYLAVQSKPQESKFIFTYEIVITNNSSDIIHIHTRNWTITDALNNISFIEGEGIAGQKPVIKPGESFRYQSSCELKTSFGTMRGYYTAVTDKSQNIQIDIPEFILAHPYAIQ